MRILVDSKAVVESSLTIALCGLDEVSARRERGIDRVHVTVTTMLDAERVEHEGATQIFSPSPVRQLSNLHRASICADTQGIDRDTRGKRRPIPEVSLRP